jgi:hypothetical protein
MDKLMANTCILVLEPHLEKENIKIVRWSIRLWKSLNTPMT